MSPTRPALALPDGALVPVPPRGLTLGRDPSCDVVLPDPTVSRLHAHALPTGRGVRVSGMAGREVGHAEGSHASVELVPGERFSLGAVAVEVARAPVAPFGPARWLIGAGRCWVALPDHGGTVGGGDELLHLPDLPARAIDLRPVLGGLIVHARVAARVGDRPLPRGASASLGEDRVVRVGPHELRLLRADAAVAADHTTSDTHLPERAAFRFLPNGGQLALHFRDHTHRVHLSEQQSRLVALLVDPPVAAPDGWVANELLIERVWPRDDARGASRLHQLVHRVRARLIAAGLDGYALIETAERGEATRLGVRRGPSSSPR